MSTSIKLLAIIMGSMVAGILLAVTVLSYFGIVM